jgi:hypothetical protein
MADSYPDSALCPSFRPFHFISARSTDEYSASKSTNQPNKPFYLPSPHPNQLIFITIPTLPYAPQTSVQPPTTRNCSRSADPTQPNTYVPSSHIRVALTPTVHVKIKYQLSILLDTLFSSRRRLRSRGTTLRCVETGTIGGPQGYVMRCRCGGRVLNVYLRACEGEANEDDEVVEKEAFLSHRA